MSKKSVQLFLTLICIILIPLIQVNAQDGLLFDKYHKVSEVQNALKALNNAYPATTKLHNIATSPGGNAVYILEIGKELKNSPAVFVGANFEGITPISTEGALYLAKTILNAEKGQEKAKWYIMPLPNPDAAKNFFASTVYEKSTNDMKINNDVDDMTDEDGFDDLNNDNFITKMRVKHPEGTYKVSAKDPRILERADAKKGERGIYKVYTEGIDNDGDGKYNEDGPGGVNVGLNFPHMFNNYLKESGLYPGCTPEVYAIMKFIYEHPEIAMVQTLGTTNFCLVPPKGGRKGGANMESIRIPRRYATMLGAETGRTYTMAEVIEMVKPMMPEGMEVTPSIIASFMGLGAAVNPLEDDLKFYTKFSEDYKKYLKEKKFNTERLDPPKAKDGSFELWAYYHLGLPSFSMNLFTVPKAKEEKKKEEGLTLDEVEKMSTDDFVALGEEKIGAFLKTNKAPERFNAKGIIDMMKSGRFSPKQLAGMMKKMPKETEEGELKEKDKALLSYIDKNNKVKGFVNWEQYNHPTLGEVEIGGYVPFLESTPSAEKIDSLCIVQIPWLLKLTENLPEIKFLNEKVTDMGSGIYKLEIFVENKGYLPYPIAMGQRNSQPAPVVVTLAGSKLEFLKGKKRTPLGNIGGNQVKKLTWMIKVEKGQTITAEIESKSTGTDVKQIKIGG